MVCVPAVLGAHSRSAIVGMACMIALLSFLVFPPKYVIRTALSLMVVGLVAFFGLTYLQSLSEGSQSAGLERRTDQLFDFLRGDIRGATTGGRFDLGNEAIGLWRDKPIIGHGLGFMNEMPVHGVGPHNMIFKMLGDSGLAGVFVMGLFWLFFLMATIRCRIRWLKIMLIGIFLAVSFSLVSSHTGISRRFLVFQLSVMIVMLEPSTQSVIRQGSAGRNFIFFQPPNPTDPRVQYPNVRPGRPLHPSRVR